VDRQFGNLMAALRMYDLDDDTLVVFSSDHGDGAAAHRWTQKQVFYEEPVRVPLIVRPAGGMSPLEDDRLVNAGIQILPTLLDYAGLESPSGVQGCSLRPAVERRDDRRPDCVVAETDFCGESERWGAGGRMVRTDRFKYCVYDALRENDTTEQFFDLREDPGEMRSLIGDPAVEPEVQRLRELLREWQKRTGDEWSPST
jgi:choline-sulfatase